MANSPFKNIMIIDGAFNCAYDIFQISATDFKIIFPTDGQDIQFIEDVHYDSHTEYLLKQLWQNPVAKSDVVGIHGTLYFGMLDKKKFFPNKRDSDLDFNGRAFSSRSRR